MKKQQITLEAFQNEIGKKAILWDLQRVLGKEFQILYDYNDFESVMGYLFFYSPNGIVLVPIASMDGFAYHFQNPRMMGKDDIYIFDEFLTKCKRKQQTLADSMIGEGTKEDYTFEEAKTLLIEEDVKTESQLSNFFDHYTIQYVPMDKPRGFIVFQLKDQPAYLAFYESYPYNGFEKLDPYILQPFKEKHYETVRNYQVKLIEDVEFVLKKQRLRKLF